MRILAIAELMRMTRNERCNLAAQTVAGFPATAKALRGARPLRSTCAMFARLSGAAPRRAERTRRVPCNVGRLPRTSR